MAAPRGLECERAGLVGACSVVFFSIRVCVGEDGFEPPKVKTSRFTVCPIWPLWYSPLLRLQSYALFFIPANIIIKSALKSWDDAWSAWYRSIKSAGQISGRRFLSVCLSAYLTMAMVSLSLVTVTVALPALSFCTSRGLLSLSRAGRPLTVISPTTR